MSASPRRIGSVRAPGLDRVLAAIRIAFWVTMVVASYAIWIVPW